MKHIKLLSFIFLFLLISCFVSCNIFMPENRNFYGGKILDNNAMAELQKEFNESNSATQTESQSLSHVESEDISTNEEITYTDTVSNNSFESETVYWAKSGSVWHLFRDCGYLKKSNEVFSGSVNQAKANGAKKVCSSCAKRAGN